MHDTQSNQRQWLSWTTELQSLAQAGLYYGENRFDLERYQRIREIAAEMMSAGTGIPVETVKGLFCNESGYQTPKIDTRAAIFRRGAVPAEDAVLLVQELNGKWSLPGGWCDIDQSPAENAVKEVREEAGVDASADLLIAVQDRDRHNFPKYAFAVTKIFYLCTARGGAFVPNTETLDAAYFQEDALPPLAEEKCTAEQIAMCFAAYRADTWKTQFD